MHGGDVRGNFVPYRFGDFQGANLGTDGLGQPRRGFAGGGGETDAQGFACLHRRRLEQRQQAHDGRGFAGARATGDNAERTAGRQGAGEFLPVDHFAGPGGTEQAGQALGQVVRGGFMFRQALSQRVIDTPFVSPVATQVQAFAR
ncbi:hypothetical protein D3C84_709160 [compost metagenome]